VSDVAVLHQLFSGVVVPSDVPNNLLLCVGVTGVDEEPAPVITSVTVGIKDIVKVVATGLAEVVGGEVDIPWPVPDGESSIIPPVCVAGSFRVGESADQIPGILIAIILSPSVPAIFFSSESLGEDKVSGFVIAFSSVDLYGFVVIQVMIKELLGRKLVGGLGLFS
jgi:hypothetical protein